MSDKVKLPEKPRRHRWVTEAINSGSTKLSVWPSPEDKTSEAKQKRFFETLAKVGSDPRVIKVERCAHDVAGDVFVFHLNHD